MDELSVLTWRVPKASASVVEGVTLPEKDRVALLTRIREAAGATELVYVPTCQRVVVALLHAPADAAARVQAAYRDVLGREAPAPEAFRAREAFAHLAQVSSSLDSLVVGEPQILGQVKDAVAWCDDEGVCGPGLRHVFALVFRAAKGVRAETDLFRGKVSLVPLTEDLVVEHAARLGAPPRAAVFGTGQMGQRMVEVLRRHGVQELHVVSRDAKRAEDAARELDAKGHALDAFLTEPPAGLDVVALAMGADAPILDAKRMELLAGGRSLLVLDLAIPRNAEAPATGIPGVRLVQMDDLSEMSARARAGREQELDAAHAILRRELDRIEAEYEERKLAHDLAQLSQRFDEVARERRTLAPPEAAADDAGFDKWYEQTVRALLHEAAAAVKRAGCRTGERGR